MCCNIEVQSVVCSPPVLIMSQSTCQLTITGCLTEFGKNYEQTASRWRRRELLINCNFCMFCICYTLLVRILYSFLPDLPLCLHPVP